jgi:(1->4)-alpha-D-glucan 1-alpha-D-glucosylmutase
MPMSDPFGENRPQQAGNVNIDGVDVQALERLCAWFGIDTGYYDIWGTRHAVAPEGLLALVAEFASPADLSSGAKPSLESTLHGLHAAHWHEVLPPVVAIAEGQQNWSLSLRLPDTMATQALRWRVVDESGGHHSGVTDSHAAPEIGRTEIDGTVFCERRLELTLDLPAGYHRLTIEGMAGDTLVISAPAHCHRPEALQAGGKVWGPAVQLYALRSPRNWGIGDFSDLAQLTEQVAQQGAGIIGLNPLHALFAHNPAHTSPYSPSSRLQLNVLYIDVEAVDGFYQCESARQRVQSPEFQMRLVALRDLPLVEHVGVAELKFEVLELLYADFRERHLVDGIPGASDVEAALSARDGLGQAFLDFIAERGEALQRHALFEALQASFHDADPSVWGWPVWPEAYRDHAGTEVARFAHENAVRVQFHKYLQWQAARQLARVSDRCEALGLAVGLYLDLAVSVDRAGSDVWGQRDDFAPGATVGAPPDEFNPNGQGWGLPPLRPDRLRSNQYRFFIETLRSSMRGAGALRIDHVMGLMRLFWIPPGRTARDGAYVHYALDEMLAIVALESQRNRCMVIGEDLGTVADAMRAALARFEVLSYRLLYFERHDDGSFKAPEVYPRDALVAISTHDLATLTGWWAGHDLRLRLQLGLFPNEQLFEKQLLDRTQERVRLLLAVQHAGLLTADAVAEAGTASVLPPQVVEAIHAFMAATPSQIMMVQMEDVLGEVEQVNMPGTTSQHPNWCRKLPLELKAIDADVNFGRLAKTLSALRPHAQLRSATDASAVLPGSTSSISSIRSMNAVIPRATYRLQFHKDFGFDDAIAILPYLSRLGVSHIYCSPIQRARPGSMHGYDVVAHNEVNPELGGRPGFDRFCAALQAHGMGQLLDMVPNHMGVLGADNAWWMDVLENGPASLFAQHFDIDWFPLNLELTGKVLLPVLGDHYGDSLARGELVLTFEPEAGSLVLRYHEHRFPLAPHSYPMVLAGASKRIDDADLAESLASVSTAFGNLPHGDATQEQALIERARDKELLKSRLARRALRKHAVLDAITAAVAHLNSEGERDALHALIEAQAWRLAYWRVAADDINYRRFFDINELAALRMEREEVFEATQSFALDLAATGQVDGLRIDHPDGLYDPARYFEELQQGYARRAGFVLPGNARSETSRPARPLYVVAEKIAAPHEEVPTGWHIHGTTGYRFANVANGVLVDTGAAERFGRIWRRFTGVEQGFDTLARIGKRDIMRTGLASELNVLSTELLRIARADRRTRDYTQNALRRALAEVVACMPVYRTYIIEQPSPQDLHYIDWAVNEARVHSDDADTSVFDFVRQTLLGQAIADGPPGLDERVRRFAIRFQQFTAPVAAKGVEDTAFYRYFPLSSLNEVGGEPALFGMSVAAFHEASADRAARWPHTMLATSTHDNKRSEDVRNRINVLSEMPAAWRLALRRWRNLNAGAREAMEGTAPSAADEYLLYQTLLGTLPDSGLDAAGLKAYADRIVRYMLKAARESKVHTRWTHPDEAYEAALEGFVRKLLGHIEGNPFLDDAQALGSTLAWFGALNSLTLTLVKYASPGVPDLYQGNELMDLSLVDPDNRRPVDYAMRLRWLEELEQRVIQSDAAQPSGVAALAQALAGSPFDGRAKLWVTWRLLSLRREQPALFRDGDYVGLKVTGKHAAHVIAFSRSHEDQHLIVLAGRLFSCLDRSASSSESGEAAGSTATAPSTSYPTTRALPLGEAVWGDTGVALPGWTDGARFENVLTGEVLVVTHGVIRLAHAFANFPAAALRAL